MYISFLLLTTWNTHTHSQRDILGKKMNRHQAEGFVRDRNTGEDEVLIDG